MGNIIGLQMHTRRLTDWTAVIDFHGELDIATSPKAKEMLLTLLGEGYRQLIVNLRHTEYIDSSGLGALVGTLRRAREQGGAVRLIGLSGRVRRLFEITRLTQAFPIDANEEAALAEIAGSQVITTE